MVAAASKDGLSDRFEREGRSGIRTRDMAPDLGHRKFIPDAAELRFLISSLGKARPLHALDVAEMSRVYDAFGGEA